ERVVDGPLEDLVAEDVLEVLQADERAWRPNPVIGQAEVDRHAERVGDEARDQEQRGKDEPEAEDMFLFPPLTQARETADVWEPGRLQDARPDSHDQAFPSVLSLPWSASLTWSSPHAKARFVGMPLTAFATMSGRMKFTTMSCTAALGLAGQPC